MARLQLKSEMQSRGTDTRVTYAEECHTARAVDLFVNVRLWCHYLLSPSVSSACVMWGEVSPCHHHARDQPAVCVYCEPSQALRRRGENDTEALSSNPWGVICTSVSLIDDYWSNACLWKKNLWDCYFPLQPAKRILNVPDKRFLPDGSGFFWVSELWYSIPNNYCSCQ